jgi:hypothetical protein
MDPLANGSVVSAASTAVPSADIITRYLAEFAARLSGPYDVRVIAAKGQLPYVNVVSHIDQKVSDSVLCDFSTDPPGYLTAFGHRLGDAADPGAAAAAFARIFQVSSTT